MNHERVLGAPFDGALIVTLSGTQLRKRAPLLGGQQKQFKKVPNCERGLKCILCPQPHYYRGSKNNSRKYLLAKGGSNACNAPGPTIRGDTNSNLKKYLTAKEGSYAFYAPGPTIREALKKVLIGARFLYLGPHFL